jgi:hypothetical protein
MEGGSGVFLVWGEHGKMDGDVRGVFGERQEFI